MTALTKKPGAALCRVCGTRIDPVAGDTHPACDPTVAADFVAAEMQRRHAVRLGQEGRARALRADANTRAWALNHLRALTHRQPFVSADDLGDDFDAYPVPGEMRGGLWSTAKARGWVTPVDEIVSERPATHGKKIARYKSENYGGNR